MSHKKGDDMKKLLLIGMFSLVMMNSSEAKQRVGVGFEIFYSSLSSHGEWVQVDFGYAWRPYHIRHGWRPYLDGRWVWTEYGWYWVSYEPFGWAVYHYGRWYYDDYYGWIWIPDDVWGPAWVEWRYNDDYIGWAPLPPYARFSVSVGISFTTRWVAPVHYWNFVPCRHFTTTRVVDYVQPVERTRRFFGNTRTATEIRGDGNRVVNRGVDIDFVERRTNGRVNRVEVVENEREQSERFVRSSGRERIEVYRPQIEGRRGEETVRPPKVRGLERESERAIGRERRDSPTYERRESDRPAFERDATRRREMSRPSEQFQRNERREFTKPSERLRQNENREQYKMREFRTPERQSQPSPKRENSTPQRRGGERRRP